MLTPCQMATLFPDRSYFSHLQFSSIQKAQKTKSLSSVATYELAEPYWILTNGGKYFIHSELIYPKVALLGLKLLT